MLIKVIVMLAVVTAVGSSSFLRSPGIFVATVKNKEETAARWQQQLFLEQQIIKWYYQHNGTFPDALTADVLHKMGIASDILKYTGYGKSNDGRRFYLVVGLVSGEYKFTPKSGVPLPEI